MRFSVWMAALLLACGSMLNGGEIITSKVDRLNVRAGQSTSSAVVGKLGDGEKVTALRANDQWVEIEPAAAYIARSLLKDGKTAARCNLRSGPGTNFPALGRCEAAVAVKILDDGKGEWVKIAPPPGIAGYVARSMVSGDLSKLPKLDGSPAVATVKNDDKKPEAPKNPPAAGPAKIEELPFDDLPVVSGSGREVTVTGDFLPIKNTGGIKFALAVVKDGKYQLQYLIHVGKSGKKFDALAEKKVRIVGVSYRVDGWDASVLKPFKITPIETR